MAPRTLHANEGAVAHGGPIRMTVSTIDATVVSGKDSDQLAASKRKRLQLLPASALAFHFFQFTNRTLQQGIIVVGKDAGVMVVF